MSCLDGRDDVALHASGAGDRDPLLTRPVPSPASRLFENHFIGDTTGICDGALDIGRDRTIYSLPLDSDNMTRQQDWQ